MRTSDHGRERNNCLNHHLQFKAVIGEKRERKSAGSQSARFSGFVACVKALQQSCVTGGDELIRNLCSFWSSLFREPFLFFLRAFLFLRAKAISICTFAIKNGRTCLEGGGPMHHETKTPGGVRCSRQSCHERGSSLSSANWQHIWATKTTPTPTKYKNTRQRPRMDSSKACICIALPTVRIYSTDRATDGRGGLHRRI